MRKLRVHWTDLGSLAHPSLEFTLRAALRAPKFAPGELVTPLVQLWKSGL
jgi:hypothetical protein